MPAQLPPLDRKASFQRQQAARFQQDRTIVAVAPWSGARHRRWTAGDVLTYTDAFPIAFALFLVYLTVGR